MSKNTVRPALTGRRTKRAARSVENAQFDAFARRIVAAYARRVAAGDIEALRSLADLRLAVDTAIRTAVRGLHEFGYSWTDVGDRLGVARQSAQERYGDPNERIGLDRRLIDAGLAVSVATLVAVFSDHRPGVPAASTCPGCGYCYQDGEIDCPSAAATRPVLYRRRAEDQQAFARLTPDQIDDLQHPKRARSKRVTGRQASQPAPASTRDATLLDLLTEEESAL